MDKINFGIIGMGNRGSYIGKYVFPNNSHINLAAVCDGKDSTLEEWKEKKVRTYKHYEELLSDEEIDAVFITTPDGTHAEIAIRALKAGKHVICEKPLEITEEKILSIVKAAKEHNKIFMLGFVLRYAPLFIKIKELIASGIVGTLIMCEARDNINYGGFSYFHDWHRERRHSESLLLQKATHSLDILNWMIDSYPKKVAGFGSLDVFGEKGAMKIFGHPVDKALKCSECSKQKECEENIENVYRLGKAARREQWPDACLYASEIDVQDNQSLIIKYDNGVKANYNLCLFTPEYKREFIFIGDKGKLVADDKSKTITVAFRNTKDVISYEVPNEGVHGGGDERLMEDFINCYYHNKKPIASLKDGAISALLALAAQKAIDQEQIVEVKTID